MWKTHQKTNDFIISQKIYNAFYSEDIAKGLFHGHTYSANPLACAAALAGVELLVSPEMQNNIKRIENLHQVFAAKIKEHPKVTNIRHLGIIFAFDLDVEMERYGNVRNQLFELNTANSKNANTLWITRNSKIQTVQQIQTIFELQGP